MHKVGKRVQRDGKAAEYQEKSREYLEQSSDGYLINPATGLYEPKATYKESAIQDYRTGKVKESPFFLSIKGEWTAVVVAVAAALGLLISSGTLYLLVRTVHYSRLQWKETKRTADAAEGSIVKAQNAITQAHDQFIQDQRPYIAETTNSVSKPTCIPTPNGMCQIVWDYHITNYGKSPALDVREHKYIRIGDTAYGDSFTAGERIRRVGTAMAPTAETFSTVVGKPMTPGEYTSLVGQRVGDPISVKIVITYHDSSGNPYETGICMAYNAFFAVRFCEGNYIK